MNLRTVVFASIILFIILSITYDNFYRPWMISGTYVYDFPFEVADGPNQGDHLTLKENGNFESETWGNGTYKLNGSKLELRYTYVFGKAGFECSIYRPLFWGKPRISIERDLDYYYKKID